MADTKKTKTYPKEGMFCREHKIEVRKTGWCNECGTLKAMEDLYREGEDSAPIAKDPTPENAWTDKDLVSQLSTAYRNKNLCPDCNPVPKELKNDETVPDVEAMTLMGWELEEMEKYYKDKFKEDFESSLETPLARRSACKKAIIKNLNLLAKKKER